MGVNEQSNPEGFAAPNHFEGFDNSFRMDISDVKQLYEEVEKMLLKGRTEARGWDRLASTWTDSTEKAILMLSSEQGEREYGVVFPGLIRSSFLLSTVGLFDWYLSLVCTRCCGIAGRRSGVSISKTKLTRALNGGVRKRLSFLEENVSLSLPKHLYAPLDLILDVRNAFAHSTGIMSSAKAAKLRELQALVVEKGFGASGLHRLKLEKVGPDGYAIILDEYFVFGVFKELPGTFAGILRELESKLLSGAT